MSVQWLYRIVPVRPGMVDTITPDEQSAVAAHFGYLVDLRNRGVLILAGRTQEADPFGIVIFEADDEDAARGIAEADPAVAAGVFAMTLHPYAVAVARPGFDLPG
ncbi:YciI family protein [Microbacterium invictum]|uniref:Uncharacterized protein YciI n=1 Tax=Microbacterium invictum TaxID=515415 RepID=A0AA40SMQ6_9MICO|nr:YciI family protein [Microbacterium invictum]MBB4138984.1 uncharacterized protein YciI [Microbacterium invictum]